MTEVKRKIWFPAKRYGWGWGFPICWQVWVVLAFILLCYWELLSFFSQNISCFLSFYDPYHRSADCHLLAQRGETVLALG